MTARSDLLDDLSLIIVHRGQVRPDDPFKDGLSINYNRPIVLFIVIIRGKMLELIEICDFKLVIKA